MINKTFEETKIKIVKRPSCCEYQVIEDLKNKRLKKQKSKLLKAWNKENKFVKLCNKYSIVVNYVIEDLKTKVWRDKNRNS